MKPLPDYILIEPFHEPERTASGIELVQPKLQKHPNIGNVKAIGDNITEVGVGDVVVYHQFDQQGFRIDEQALLKVHKDEIWGIIHAEN